MSFSRLIGSVGLCLMLVGCSGTASPPGLTSPTKEIAAPAGFDPPKAFDKAAGVPLSITGIPKDALIMNGRHLFVARPDGVTAVSLPEGKQLWQASLVPTGFEVAPKREWNMRPALSKDGRTLYVASQLVRTGSGTVRDTASVVIGALDLDSGHLLWQQTIPAAADAASVDPKIINWQLKIVGQADGLIIVAYQQDITGGVKSTIAVSDTDGKVKWQSRGLPYEIAPERVVVARDGDFPESLLMGLDSATGQEVWKLDDDALRYQPVAIWHSSVDVIRSTGSKTEWLVVDARTGNVVSRNPTEPSRVACLEDAKADVVTCSSDQRSWGFMDKVLWHLPEGGRGAVEATAVYGGLVYGRGPNGPVVLDARSGADVSSDAGVAPVALSPLAGVAYDNNARAWVIYPSKG